MIKKYPFFDDFYKIIENFKRMIQNREDNEFVEFNLNQFIKTRNDLLAQYSKIEDIVKIYYSISKNVHIKKNKTLKKSKSQKMKKRRRRQEVKRNKQILNKRNKTSTLYCDFARIIQCFDRKTRPFYKKKRNSCKRVKEIKKELKNKDIRFKVKKFKEYINEMETIVARFDKHINFFLNIFPGINIKKIDKIEYIKNY